ncbi:MULTISPECIES: hypothetical protein [Pasteurellaceae]|uniref:Uncharacterized protein n=1 Tax=Pasteurella atlantica TaxID=2827233 RepID=A0AAW8CQ40_9PAST|nr:hypothetical protein [Pasteurella atlantica]MBR0574380.1 hypothetical protein [Pasteurella atlantica]MDP8040284.1 hypothetical protein [Pasteurella atlantica]MDP8042460.1 hypothetical protein [Pasteurella atlantica]MDP8044309.1 hypothetical protein [Pasteurella atlantica]MDP8046602.1 hypothetical protein [Pasteurella atlantica]
MFKQFKSALIWYYLFKLRRRLALVVFLLLIAFFADAIYEDFIEFLTLQNMLEYLALVLIIKWIIIIGNIALSCYLLITMFRRKDDPKSEEKEAVKVAVKEKFTDREKKFLDKKKLRSKADILLDD